MERCLDGSASMIKMKLFYTGLGQMYCFKSSHTKYNQPCSSMRNPLMKELIQVSTIWPLQSQSYKMLNNKLRILKAQCNKSTDNLTKSKVKMNSSKRQMTRCQSAQLKKPQRCLQRERKMSIAPFWCSMISRKSYTSRDCTYSSARNVNGRWFWTALNAHVVSLSTLTRRWSQK